MAIGKAGAMNAGIFAAEILALSDDGIRQALKDYRKAMARQVESKAKKIKKLV